MLDSYHDEVRRKRNNYAIFWGVVFIFGVFLFMFFQGYYFSMSIGFKELLKNHTVEEGQSIGMVLKSFGIINLRVTPNPSMLTLNNLPYVNGDNKFVDYGNYELHVEEWGYIPLTIDIHLSRNHSFYLNTITLFKNPVENQFERNIDHIEKLGTGFLGFDTDSKVWHYTNGTSTGKLIDTLLVANTGAMIITNTGAQVKSIGEGFFAVKNKIYTLNSSDLLVSNDLYTTLPLCTDAKIIYGEIYCPNTKKFITGKYKELRDTILEVNSEFIRTESSFIRLGHTLFNSSTPITNNVSFSGSSKLFFYQDKQVILNQNKLYDIENNFQEIKIEGFDGILCTQKFGNETVTVGKKHEETWIHITDGKMSMLEAKLEEFKGKNLSISLIGGAYIIASEKEIVLYYRGARSAFRLVQGDILDIYEKTIIYNQNGITKYLTLEEGKI